MSTANRAEVQFDRSHVARDHFQSHASFLRRMPWCRRRGLWAHLPKTALMTWGIALASEKNHTSSSRAVDACVQRERS